MIGRWRLPVLLGGALLAGLVAAGSACAAEPLVIRASPVLLRADDPAVDRVGRLIYRGGLALTSADGRFGGWSGLHVSADAARITAISDRGHWFDARLRFRADGRLQALDEARLGPLTDLFGRRLRGLAGDAEGLAVYPDGSFLVSFERRHRLWLYPASEPPFSELPRLIPVPRGATAMPENGGIETLVRLAGGRLLALSEELMDGPLHVGWIGDGVSWSDLRYRAAPEFRPTGATQLPPDSEHAGDVLVVERRFTLLGGPGARVVWLRRAAIRAGAQLEGTEIARLQAPLTVDNFEGIAVARGPRGETLVFLLSDDNFSLLQRTLLLMFELAPER